MSYDLQTFTTETGAQAIIPVCHNYDVTYALQCGETDVVDIEISLDNTDKSSYLRTVALSDQSGNLVDTTDGPVTGIGINIKTNISNSIKFEVLSAFMG